MKFKVPAGCKAIVHAGTPLVIAGDSSIDLDPTAIALLGPHGIVPVGDPAPVDVATIDKLIRDDLVAALSARGIATKTSDSIATLRSWLRQAVARPSR
jgi:hypothetical protein